VVLVVYFRPQLTSGSSLQGWFTAFVVTNIILAEEGGASLYLPGEFDTFTPEDVAPKALFSKVEFASEQVRDAFYDQAMLQRPPANEWPQWVLSVHAQCSLYFKGLHVIPILPHHVESETAIICQDLCWLYLLRISGIRAGLVPELPSVFQLLDTAPATGGMCDLS
jgi:hypothetical protein